MEDDQDFEYQLQQEALETAARQKKQEANSDATTTAAASNPYIYRDPNDGTELEWDPIRKAWFPRITDDFIAQYQASYGNYEDTTTTDTGDAAKSTDENNAASKKPENEETNQNSNESNGTEANQQTLDTSVAPGSRKRAKEPEKEPQWFDVDDEHNTNVYVSNLPLDITDEEFVELMKKCGLIMKDERNQLKIKLYRDDLGMPKGDGRCCYIKLESVDLALNILDGSIFRDHTIKVERAKFSLKGQYDPSKKPKKKRSNKRDKEKQKKRMEKLFDWRPDKLAGERPKQEKVIVITNMFDPKMFETDPKMILEYRSDLREECEEKCGPVRKVEIYDLHPDGVATVAFNEFEDADKCIELMNGRFFAGRRLDAKHWDGKTKYKVQETEEEVEKRMAKWDQFLDHQPEPETNT